MGFLNWPSSGMKLEWEFLWSGEGVTVAVAPRQLHTSGALGKTTVTMAFITGADQQDKLF